MRSLTLASLGTAHCVRDDSQLVRCCHSERSVPIYRDLKILFGQQLFDNKDRKFNVKW